MNTNPILTALGLSSNARAIVLHADDIGMCQATVDAYRQIVAMRPRYCASTMVPCSWFPAVGRLCSGSVVDMGVHLTLTSEWADYRWRPLTAAHGAGLCDAAGYFPTTAETLYARPGVEKDCEHELGTQIQRALDAGLDVTHLDCHMFALLHPRLLATYVELGRRFRLPCFLPPEVSPILEALPNTAPGGVRFDAWTSLPMNRVGNRLELAKRYLDKLPAGLSYFFFHPAVDTPELRAIAPDWEARVADLELILADAWQSIVEAAGVTVVGMRDLRDLAFFDSARTGGAFPLC